MEITDKKADALSENYGENVALLRQKLRTGDSFDLIYRKMTAGGCELSFFYIDGFVKDGAMQRVMQALATESALECAARVEEKIPYVEVSRTSSISKVVTAVLSGECALLSEGFGGEAILIDTRTYPARTTAEPESDRVMQGSRDGFVETLVMNTALIRRRIRDPRLTMEHFNVGGASQTDVVVCYMKGVADEKYLRDIKERIASIRPKGLTLGFQSLSESMIRRKWYNPFPKIRTTERPDTAASQLLEGSILIICDTSPEVMILPTAIFDYLQQTDDYCFPPLTGSYMRIIRAGILLFSFICTPLWYLYLEYADSLPDALRFLIPEGSFALPIILQLFLAEIAIDGLKIASMNTPGMLSNSLSIVGALILGDFAVEVGWLSADVILYMAFVAIANFAQQNYELGYAFKFMRMILLALTAIFKVWGFAAGILIAIVAIATNNTVASGRGYLYPLLPFNPRALRRLVIREQKADFEG
ncbi:MAG: spore germination protein [Clostridia bacterium]|nr:spore germination protein [Clostridia bacterium]